MKVFYHLPKIFAVLFLFFLSSFGLETDGSNNGVEMPSFSYHPATRFIAAELEKERLQCEKELVISVLPNKLKVKVQSISESDFLTISEIIEKGDNYPKTDWNDFRREVWNIAVEAKAEFPDLGCDTMQLYNWIMKTFRAESGFRSDVKNPYSSASGIFQVLLGNRKRLGFPENWTRLSVIQQLKWYKVYLFDTLKYINCREKIVNRGEFYMINFMYAYIGFPGSKVLAKSCHGTCKHYGVEGAKYCVYHANACFDKNRDGIVRKSEVIASMEDQFKVAWKKSNGSKQDVKVIINSEHFDMLSFNLKSSLSHLRLSLE